MIRHLLVIAALCYSQISFAQNSGERRGADKLDLNQLEQKYWSAKDDNFKVVQNRVYTKEGRLSASLQHGYLMNDGFTQGTMSGVALSYHFTEHFGLEANYFQSDLSDTEAVTRVQRLGGGVDYSVLQNSMSLTALWIPFYAKMSVFDRSIIYFDMAFGLGVGQSSYDIQTKELGPQAESSPHVSIDVTQYFYVNTNFAVRVDFKHQIYQQKRLRYSILSTEDESDRPLPDTQYNNTIMTLGLTYFF